MSHAMTISSVEGNRQWLDGGAMFGNAPRPVWQKRIPPDELGRIPLACRSLLIEIDQIKILCEVGIGAFFEPKLAERYGVEDPTHHRLIENLKTLNVSPDDINYVILSHLHFDHAGGLLPVYPFSEKDDLNFKNAQYVVGTIAWERALKPHFRDRASFIPGLCDRLKSSGRLLLVNESTSLPKDLENIEFIFTHGHTPGQMHTVVHGPKETIVFAGDLIPGVPWVHLPITMGYDRFPEQLIDEKQNLYNRAVKENWWVFFTHDPQYACAQITKDDQGRFTAKNQKTTLNSVPL